MAHPFNSARDHKVQRSRVATITKACGGGMSGGGSASGGSSSSSSKAVKQRAMRAEGGAVKARADRPARARGGRLNRKGNKKGTTVNVIVAPQQAATPGMPPRPAAPPGAPPGIAPPMPPIKPPMAGPPPMAGGVPGGPAMPPGVPPPGLMMRKRGGAVFSGKPNKVSVNAKHTTGSNKADSQTAGAGKGRTPIRRSFPSNKGDTPNIGRKAVITKAAGGTVNAATNADIPQRATGGPISSPAKGHMGPQFSGGARGGMAKLEKGARAARQKYGRPTISVKNPTQNPAA